MKFRVRAISLAAFGRVYNADLPWGLETLFDPIGIFSGWYNRSI